MVWVLLVDCVRVVEFDHILYVFLSVWLLRKCKKREEDLEFLIFWATMFLGRT